MRRQKKPIEIEALEVILWLEDAKVRWLKKQGVDDPYLWQSVEEGDHNDWYGNLVVIDRYIALIGLGRWSEITNRIANERERRAESIRRQAINEIEREMEEASFLMERDEIRLLRPPLGVAIEDTPAPTTVDGIVPCPNCNRLADYQHNIFAEPDWDARYIECWSCNRVYVVDDELNLVDVVGLWDFKSDYWGDVIAKNPHGMPRPYSPDDIDAAFPTNPITGGTRW